MAVDVKKDEGRSLSAKVVSLPIETLTGKESTCGKSSNTATASSSLPGSRRV